jgi:hypothetical protein
VQVQWAFTADQLLERVHYAKALRVVVAQQNSVIKAFPQEQLVIALRYQHCLFFINNRLRQAKAVHCQRRLD